VAPGVSPPFPCPGVSSQRVDAGVDYKMKASEVVKK